MISIQVNPHTSRRKVGTPQLQLSWRLVLRNHRITRLGEVWHVRQMTSSCGASSPHLPVAPKQLLPRQNSKQHVRLLTEIRGRAPSPAVTYPEGGKARAIPELWKAVYPSWASCAPTLSTQVRQQPSATVTACVLQIRLTKW
jgi:hypothetical protein